MKALDNFELLIILMSVLPVFIVIGFTLVFQNRDFVLFRTKSYKIQMNLLNWSSPSWTQKEKLKNYFKHFGPILIVSNKLYVKNVCGRGCCNSVEVAD